MTDNIDEAVPSTEPNLEEFDADAHVADALSGSEEAPAELETTEEISDDSSGIEIGGEKYELPALEELITLGKDAKEIKAESTRKFQEASEMRKRAEWADQLEAAWNAGPEGRAQLIANLQKLDREQGGGLVVPNQAEEVSFEDMSPEGRFLYQQVVRLQAENAALRNEVTPTLREVSGFVGQTKADRQNEAWAKEITATYGDEMTAAQVAEMIASGGITDPVKAYGFMKPKIAQVYAKGHEQGAKPKPETPEKSRSKVFDDSNMPADDIVFGIMRGGIPASSLKK